MKVSLRATYGIIAAIDLALHHGEQPVCAKSIAKRQAIPARFLEQVLHAMKKAGVVASQRGAQGGYVLSRKPSEVSVADILHALEGPLMQTNGASGPKGSSSRGAKRDMLLAHLWDRVKQAELGVLSEVTVEELATRQRALEAQHTLMYHI
ncbi:MAG: HTH-type transcriptional regulator CymR [Nitrospirae bacterium]|nr:MAG: putative HTH-type transcriptional regulator [Nitrospira sp. OLB3]MBV6469996.1 HTH-type transcriptional regulator CymR [Nitrospirota bacterium]MCE7964597.1 Rrf2 family transcriptional regulator [Nitrospira sp. NTP2]MCK6493789.1 Rrf2 family transcriptional regulator [Nitrospira sp.]MEB2338307.1 Rrf2 family transcriptional regulator [Nitrospirales bacterium]